MNKINLLLLALILSLSFSLLPAQEMASLYSGSTFLKGTAMAPLLPAEQYSAYFSISHGHCQLPMEARFTNVNIQLGDKGMDGIKIDFELSSNSLVAVNEPEGEHTLKMKSAKSFDAAHHPTMRFVCRDSYRLGEDWFQLNGLMTIKGESVPVTFRGRPIYDSAGCGRTLKKFVLDGQVNLKDFGVSEGNVGGADELPRTMFMNMAFVAGGC